MRDRRKTVRWTIGTAVVALTGLACVTVALAQTRGVISEAGPVVAITGGGDDVKAVGARVSVDGAMARVKAAGAVVDVRGAVEGGIWAAGADVTIVAQTGGDVYAAGARVSVRGRIAGDVRAAGALVDIDVATAGDLKAAGANVRIGALTDVRGSVAAAGANVVFDGHVAGRADFAGAVVTVNGRVDGPVSIHAQKLIVGPQAVIAGGLLVRSLSEAEIDPGAQISGDIVHERPGRWFDDMPEASMPIITAVFAAAVILSGIIFLIFARNTYSEGVDHVRFRPLSTIFYGILAVLILLLVAALLMATVIGFGLGLGLVLLMPIVFVLGQPVAAAGITGWIFGRRFERLGAGRLLLYLVVGAIAITFAGLIPVTGPWIVAVALLFGIGGFLRAVLWRFRTTRATGRGGELLRAEPVELGRPREAL
jgi:cytoskeletal protein CcmA (bactofilin family)